MRLQRELRRRSVRPRTATIAGWPAADDDAGPVLRADYRQVGNRNSYQMDQGQPETDGDGC